MSATPTVTEPRKPGPILVEMVKAEPKPRKKLIRRLIPDRSQQTRRTVQIAFMLINIVIGIQFYQFVRYYETGVGHAVGRPAGVEGYLPIAGLMNLKAALLTGEIPKIHPAGMFLIVAFLTISFVFRKTFCSWLCPVGTVSEYLWKLGKKIFKRNLRLPRWLDIGLRGLKYLLLGFFLWAVYSMVPRDIHAFLESPYGLIADVKMLNFFRFFGQTGLIVIGVLVLLSVIIQNFWCRYLCPYGALMGVPALLSPLRIRRNPETCIDCAKCAKACPSRLPMDQLITIKSAECTACMECVAVCPAEGALVFAAPGEESKAVPAWAVAAGIAAIFLGTVGFAKATGRWDSDIPAEVYRYLIPNAEQATHPMPGKN
jgi:polyferredoxin